MTEVEAFRQYASQEYPAWQAFHEVETSGLIEFKAIEARAWSDWELDHDFRRYQAILKEAWAKHQAAREPAWQAYVAIRDPAWQRYLQVTGQEADTLRAKR